MQGTGFSWPYPTSPCHGLETCVPCLVHEWISLLSAMAMCPRSGSFLHGCLILASATGHSSPGGCMGDPRLLHWVVLGRRPSTCGFLCV